MLLAEVACLPALAMLCHRKEIEIHGNHIVILAGTAAAPDVTPCNGCAWRGAAARKIGAALGCAACKAALAAADDAADKDAALVAAEDAAAEDAATAGKDAAGKECKWKLGQAEDHGHMLWILVGKVNAMIRAEFSAYPPLTMESAGASAEMEVNKRLCSEFPGKGFVVVFNLARQNFTLKDKQKVLRTMPIMEASG